MIRIELEDRDAETLRLALEDYVSDLRMEVADTDSQAFRDDLKETERVLRSLIDRLRPKSPQPS